VRRGGVWSVECLWTAGPLGSGEATIGLEKVQVARERGVALLRANTYFSNIWVYMLYAQLIFILLCMARAKCVINKWPAVQYYYNYYIYSITECAKCVCGADVDDECSTIIWSSVRTSSGHILYISSFSFNQMSCLSFQPSK
jgi:hypothetical protein